MPPTLCSIFIFDSEKMTFLEVSDMYLVDLSINGHYFAIYWARGTERNRRTEMEPKETEMEPKGTDMYQKRERILHH